LLNKLSADVFMVKISPIPMEEAHIFLSWDRVDDSFEEGLPMKVIASSFLSSRRASDIMKGGGRYLEAP
jgi:hypothetical protein